MEQLLAKLASSVSAAVASGQVEESERERNVFHSNSAAFELGKHGIAVVAVAVSAVGILMCAMFVFMAWLCAQGKRKRKHQKKNEAVDRLDAPKDPMARLDDKIRQAERDARRGDTFGDSDDGDGCGGDGDGDGEGP